MTIELPERHPSPPLHPCTEPNSETFEKLRRTRLLLMNLVREGVIHRSEYARLMRRTLIDHFVVAGARHGSQFAGARDVIGAPEVELSVPGPCDAGELWSVLISRFPALAPYQRSIRLAVNGAYATEADRVVPGDEVALIPPVAGG